MFFLHLLDSDININVNNKINININNNINNKCALCKSMVLKVFQFVQLLKSELVTNCCAAQLLFVSVIQN